MVFSLFEAASKNLITALISPWRVATSPPEVWYFIFRCTLEGTAMSSAKFGLMKMRWYKEGRSITRIWVLIDLAVSSTPKVTIDSVKSYGLVTVPLKPWRSDPT